MALRARTGRTWSARTVPAEPGDGRDDPHMSDWRFAQDDPAEELAQVTYFSMKKHQQGKEVEFIVTVREYVNRNAQNMRFFAQADKQVNQQHGGFLPFGWGETMLGALSECLRTIRTYPYDGETS
jgi:hypothetical protein